jgi:hypothetical protein
MRSVSTFLADLVFLLHSTTTFHVLHLFSGFVATNVGSSMPSPILFLIRAMMSVLAKSKEECAETMCGALLSPSYGGGGFRIMDENGNEGKKTPKHTKEAKDIVWDHTVKFIEKYK